jgi:hypothetical protein
MWPSSARNSYTVVTERLQRRRRRMKVEGIRANVVVASVHFQVVSD